MSWSALSSSFAKGVGAVSAVGAIALIALGASHALPTSTETPCVAAAPSPYHADGLFRVVAITPGDLQFGHHVCVTVENVLSQSDWAALKKDADTKKRALESETGDKKSGLGAAATSAAAALANAVNGKDFELNIDGNPSALVAHATGRAGPQVLSYLIRPDQDANSDRGKFWTGILSSPAPGGRLKLDLGIATPGSSSIYRPELKGSNSSIGNTEFKLYDARDMPLWNGALVLLIISLGILSYNTTLLRDGSLNTNAYSLSRTQMAFWTIITAVGFVWVWGVKGQFLNVLPSSAFILIGISGLTGAAASAIDPPNTPTRASGNFLRDIVGNWEGGSVQIHRLQIVIWNLILGSIFIYYFLAEKRLINFDDNLLLLLGVSDSVYIAMKTQEEPGKGSKSDKVPKSDGVPEPEKVPEPARV